jgi:cyclin-dependent kinase 2
MDTPRAMEKRRLASLATLQGSSPKFTLKHLKTDIPVEDEPFVNLLTTKENLLKQERLGKLAGDPTLSQVDINTKMRVILADWLYEVALMFKIKPETYLLTINIVDAYLSRVQIMRNNLQLVGIASMHLASCYIEIYPPEVTDYAFISDNTYTRDEIIKMSEDIFKVLGCNMNLANEMEFVRYSSSKALSELEEHNLVKALVIISRLEPFDALPSVMVSAARYIACEHLKIPFVNVFEIDESTLRYFTYKLHVLLRKLPRSSINSWKKLNRTVRGIEGVIKDISLLKFPAARALPVTSKKSYYHITKIELDLIPEPIFNAGDPILGEGTYGIVTAFDYKGTTYAVKQQHDYDNIINNSFVREVSMLQSLQHPNIIQLKFVSDKLESIFIDLGVSDLKKWLNNNPLDHQQQIVIAKQLLSAMTFMHENGAIHRDFKPQNIIVFIEQGKPVCRISDLGFCRGTNLVMRDNSFTHEICTLWYRSPEILLGSSSYGDRLDVWSMMCVLYECGTNKPLFPGDSEIDQLFKIFMITGTPDETTWPGVSSLADYKPTFPKWKPQEDYFDKNVLLSDCYKDIINTGLILNVNNRPRISRLLEILEDYETGRK